MILILLFLAVPISFIIYQIIFRNLIRKQIPISQNQQLAKSINQNFSPYRLEAPDNTNSTVSFRQELTDIQNRRMKMTKCAVQINPILVIGLTSLIGMSINKKCK